MNRQSNGEGRGESSSRLGAYSGTCEYEGASRTGTHEVACCPTRLRVGFFVLGLANGRKTEVSGQGCLGLGAHSLMK